jgi:protein phosphatase
MQFRSAALSDIGLLRKDNQDRFLCDDSLALYGVADGIGGLPCGDIAAEETIQAILHCIAESGKREPDLLRCIKSANERVLAASRIDSPVYGMGSTLCFGLLSKDTMNIAHVGDSRCYLFRGGALRCLTTDHNVENELDRLRMRGESILLTERNRGALTRCIGQPEVPEADLIEQKLEPGDRLLFCTDGLYRMLSDEDLASELKNKGDPGETLDRLVPKARSLGGFDNITGVLLDAG